MNNYSIKVCKTCGVSKSLDEFYNNKNHKDKKANDCKVCSRLKSAKYRNDNRQAYSKRMSEYYKNHIKEVKEYKAEHYKNNIEKYKESYEKFSKGNKESRIEYQKNWRKLNKDKRRVHRQNRRAKIKSAEGTFTPLEFEKLLIIYKNCCYYCEEYLTVAHIEHFIPLDNGGSNHISNIVPSCPKCNLSKGTKMPWEFKKGESGEPRLNYLLTTL